jgi:hypothetical protein
VPQESGCAPRRAGYDPLRAISTTNRRTMQSTRTLIAGTLALSLAALTASDVASAETRTSKERLSNKAADEQRVDNCRVPVDQRGTAPRPDCSEAEAAGSRATPGATRDGGSDPSRR